MNRTIKIYLFFLFVLLAGVLYIDAVRPKPVDWNPTYNLKDKIPYGLSIFNEQMPGLLPNNNIKKISETVYEHFEPLYDYDSLVKDYKVKGTVLHICDNYLIDDQSSKELFYFVGHGNTAFLSVQNLPKIFTDSLNLKTDSDFDYKNRISCWLTNKNLGNKKYDLHQGGSPFYFSSIDTLNTTVLGYQGSDQHKKINYIKVPYRNGTFLIHLQPVAFTNYHLLKEDHAEYTEKVLAYMPAGTIYWMVKEQNGLIREGTPFQYLLSQPALKWAWYLFLVGMLVFIIFNAKRKQRIIPILKPLPNTTVDFTKTIGNLYFQEGDHQNLINKKIVYFLERIRNEYLIETTILDEHFITKLQAKTGKDLKDIEHLVYLINYQRRSYQQSIESDLIAINNAIEKIIN